VKAVVEKQIEESVNSKNKQKEFIEYVFVLENGKAVLKKVKTGVQDNMYIQIIEGLTDNTEVISGPFNVISKELINGMKVEKVDKSALYNKISKK
jgi:HlyD family secretion protein